ncbi:uncharacterized protein LOC135472503 [Liolophura sinensis]|uniref:uncharacterized protein LOC135472503 n=1 Tax=Liolophura sinensis TaxID=3198878 RepID=UPI00315849FF
MASVPNDKRKKKKKKSQKVTEIPSPNLNLTGQNDRQDIPRASPLYPYITYNIFNCENFQIGDRTTLISEARQLLKSPSDNKADVIIGMLNSILNPSCTEQPGEMNLQKLESAFDRLYGSIIEGKKQTFKMITEQPMKKFIQQHPDHFELENRQGNWNVKQCRHVDKTSTAVQSTYIDVSVERDCALVTSTDGVPTNSVVDQQISRENTHPEVSVVDDLPSKSWAKVTRNKRTMQSPSVEINRATVDRLLQTSPGPGLILQPSEVVYLENKALFSLDIVSMWNTPKISGHILLGAQASTTLPHKVTGLSQSRTDQEMQELFLAESFDTRPMFRYVEVDFLEKRVGLLTVNSSAGQGKPCTTVRSQSCFNVDQLWYRKGDESVMCKLSENMVVMDIYKWFIGSKDEDKLLDTQYNDLFKTKIDDSSLKAPQTENILDIFTKGHGILVVGQIPSNTRNLSALMKIPWLYVFDFDIESRSTGTLGACQSALESKRSLYIRHWGMPPVGVSEHSTTWCFVRGTRDIPEFRVEGNSKAWRQKTRVQIRKHYQQLGKFAADYTTLRVLVVWSNLDFCPHHLHSFLQDLDDNLTPRIEISLSLMPTSAEGNSVFQIFKTHLDIEPKIMPVERLCQDINVRFEDKNRDVLQLKLPIFNGEISQTEICDRDKLWFSEDLDVLYLDSPYSRSRDTEAISHDIDEFFKGGTIHWYTWYECSSGFIDIQRDLMDKILPELERRCRTPSKPALITLLHAPGSGGTTLAQRLLWELHTKTPCVQVRTGADFTLDQVISKINVLNKITGSPVVILMDGEEETRVNLMANQLSRIPTIILYVKRCTYRMTHIENKAGAATFYLKGEVSSDEAKRLALKLRDKVEDANRKAALNKLTENVSNGKSQCLYEFGLAAYLHEFRGVASYVRGYLHLEDNPTRDLHPWQKLLGYLALVYYYGQACVPCQFFATLIGKPPNYDVSLEDFPECAREFIKESKTYPKHIRISHYVIAQEILEQLLTRHRPSGNEIDNPDPTSLSTLAKQNLKDFAVDFIKYASQRKTKDNVVSETIIYILTKTFIMREYRDAADIPGEASEVKPKVSKLLSDLESHPPFIDQLKILNTLSESFPMDPNFHAHLGRFYTYCPPVDMDKAEQCFEKALGICDGLDKKGTKVKQTLTHVYHMYGMVYLKRVKAATQYKRGKRCCFEMQRRVEESLLQAERACDLFQKCREHIPPGQEDCYGYLNEIEVRLSMCGAIETAFGDLSQFIQNPNSDPHLVRFLTSSFSEVDSLIMQCYHNIDQDELGRFFYDMVGLFNTTFQKNVTCFEKLCTSQNSHTRRLKIATTKMKYVSNPREMTVLDQLPQEDVTEIVKMYEANFTEIKESGHISNRNALDTDYREWIVAIRCDKLQHAYDLGDVQTQVYAWRKSLKTPLSLYYVFVVTSLLGLETDRGSAKEFHLRKADELKENLKRESRYTRDSRYPREWLGVGRGIKRLVPSGCSQQGHVDRYCHKRSVKGSVESILAVCKGTICHPNKPLSGHIAMDLGNTPVQVKVFFVPKVCNLEGARNENQRVEFHLAFTMDKGYEAFNVQLLEKVQCPSCRTAVEIKSDERHASCSVCQQTVFPKESDPFSYSS